MSKLEAQLEAADEESGSGRITALFLNSSQSIDRLVEFSFVLCIAFSFVLFSVVDFECCSKVIASAPRGGPDYFTSTKGGTDYF